MFKPSSALLLLLALFGTLSGTGKGLPKVRFSSVYTDLNTQCKVLSADPGQDSPSLCRGYGGYSVVIGASAQSAYLYAFRGSTLPVPANVKTIGLAEVEINYDNPEYRRKLEWRLANGQPFAVILRVNTYRDAPNDARGPFQDVYKTGTVLRGVGLEGFERIAFEVNVRTAHANAAARARADAAYRVR